MPPTDNSNIVKVLRVADDEKVWCAYCDRRIMKRAILMRWYEENGAMRDLMMFCSHGCALAYTISQGDLIREEARA